MDWKKGEKSTYTAIKHYTNVHLSTAIINHCIELGLLNSICFTYIFNQLKMIIYTICWVTLCNYSSFPFSDKNWWDSISCTQFTVSWIEKKKSSFILTNLTQLSSTLKERKNPRRKYEKWCARHSRRWRIWNE